LHRRARRPGLLTEFGSIEAMEAVLGLAFVSIWVMSKPET
jgi:hypothetical protein